MMHAEFDALVDSDAYRDAARRVIRQLFEALLFEERLPLARRDGALLSVAATDPQGAEVIYHCHVQRSVSFARLRVVSPVRRRCGAEDAPALDVARVIAELAGQLAAEPARLAQFATELLATHVKDAQTRIARQGRLLRDADYDETEAGLTGAHPYHPTYKSRLGFTLDHNRRYAPECSPGVAPLLLAVRVDQARWAAGQAVEARDPRTLLAPAERAAFELRLTGLGLDPADYLPLPVHPWQWEMVGETACHPARARRELIPVGPMQDRYRPQQSIRTLANLERRDAPSVKLAMNLVNTSTSRVLAPHTVCNAAPISDWLDTLVASTEWAAPLARPVILKEIAGVAYLPPTPAAGQYGALACIWRDSIHAHLVEGERALPMTALPQPDADGHLLVAEMVARHGIEAWLRRLIERAWLPVLHLLWAHGTALESHAQNMVLILVDGLPERVALKDFHDGVRFSRQWLSGPPPVLSAPPAEHAAVNPNSFVETDDADELRDFTCDALLFVNLAEVAWAFAQHLDFDEARFWAIAAEAIRAHQARHPALAARFALFDCFAPTLQIEELASRRFLPELRLRTRAAPNPLAQAVQA
ncbi:MULTISPECIES: IucA/IucC family protein [unclassified Burkholderia]|uniref:IucA/IucC family protein n=1 Tax=unclassified Burkholderia TaxID=2613784 RepID=UPI001423C090|nr:MULTISPECIES: IucA/IucC family protein [unclassified Burkholderia]NIE88198.1 IucA/IucC family siderophore biosynthesis protein [Burkholderia sp. Tr-860]NIF67143.1 IucA/IucC family siderophore biosynthesis protein [Burkholderia sp. Cy-647]NIG00547.1 IucA/IucC family siderophore biosynthesis protein [Burkholderia sp. Ax-1720]